jgi:tRNA pseudouridine55 synthase
LETCGVAGNIRRLAIGNISVELISDKPVLPQELLNWEIVKVSEEGARKILNGVTVASDRCLIASEKPVFISGNGQIIAVAEFHNGYLVPKFQLG